MKFFVKERNGPARIGELTINHKKIVTPNLIFLNTDRFNAPFYANCLLSDKKTKNIAPYLQISKQIIIPKDIPINLHKKYLKGNKQYFLIPAKIEIIDEIKKDDKVSFYIISNVLQLLNHPKNFVDFIIKLREKIGYQKAIYLPAIGKPTNLALFSYLGIDLFDSISAIVSARKNILLFSYGEYNKNELNEIPCSCPICDKLKSKPVEMNFNQILNHNYYSIFNEIKNVRNAIYSGNIRNLVEKRITVEPNLSAILRNLDFYHYTYLEKRTPITNKCMTIATTKDSLFRPEIKRFQKRIIERYKKPESAKILLLLPCSAKKPYSFSKSHKLFKEKINQSNNPFIIHEVIITSPLGIVPRELELIYPASSYDITVTGVWDEDEKKMIRFLLKEYLKSNKYEKIIAHLPSELLEFIEDILKKPIKTCINHPTSNESLDLLSESLKKHLKNYNKIDPQKRIIEDILNLTSYQFGIKNSKNLLKNCQIKGRYPNKKIFYNNNQLGMFIYDRGLISLTIDGAKRIKNSINYWVKIFDDFKLIGSVFAPGVKDADKKIREGDEVIIFQKNKLIAVGVAQMNGEEMIESTFGEAVKIRHIV